MPEEQKRLFIAVAISIIVIVGTNTFFGTNNPKDASNIEAPIVETAEDVQVGFNPVDAQIETTQDVAISPMTPDGENGSKSSYESREKILEKDDRVTIKSDVLHGSIRKKGARIDDLILMKYNETQEEK